MDFADSDRPVKKRRFFVDTHVDAASLEGTSSPPQHVPTPKEPTPLASDGFDRELLESVVGAKLSDETITKIRQRAGDNVEQAVNIYFDGSWKDAPTTLTKQTSINTITNGSIPLRKPSTPGQQRPSPPARKCSSAPKYRSMPAKRYIGSFGVTGWATRSGAGLIGHEDKITIERQKTQTTRVGKGGKVVMTKKHDNIIRILNSKSQEIGRLENESAAWIAPLLDQKVFDFDASCVYAPDRMRTNDSIFLQLHAYFKKEPFEMRELIRPAEDNRTTGLFEQRETQEERNLHLRQISLVKLFDEVNLQPSKTNETTEKHKRQGLLKAAEVAEQYEQVEAKPEDTPEKGGSSDEEEQGAELEEDQLDSLYRKAQTFDFNTPEREPASTFALSLRKYQKQALHWMYSKEKDQKNEHKEVSMHPLWEEYDWPTKDADDKTLPTVEGQDKFYVNPYSGEVSLEFPRQEQNCLGGILADEMGLGKTIEVMSLIHSNRNVPPESGAATVNSLPRLPSTSTSVLDAPYTTLVIAPMSLLSQWQSEAEKASVEGSMKTLMYYGTENRANLQALCCEANAANAPNIVITSYGVVLSEYTQIASQGGIRGSHGGLFSLNYFRIVLDEAHTIKNRQSKTAKACYQLSAVHRWVLTGTPIVNRLEDLFSLVHFLRVEPWSNFSFWKTFITVPFEAGEHIKALDVVQTVLEPLVLRRTKDMRTPDGEALVPLPPREIKVESLELSKQEKEIYSLIFTRAKRTFSANVEAGTLMKSYTTIFAQILRLRQSCCHPTLTRNKDIVRDEIEAEEAADAAAGLADDMDLQNLIERFTADADEQDANIFGANALREIQAEANAECPLCFEEPMIEQSVTSCWHSACKKCLLDFIQHQIDKGEVPRCFNCREPITARDTFEVIRHDSNSPSPPSPSPIPAPTQSSDQTAASNHPTDPNPNLNESTIQKQISLRRLNRPSSAKITALLSHLTRLRKTAPNEKSVVFSQFTSFLDLIAPCLAAAKIPFLRFDGSMPQKVRANVISEFTGTLPSASASSTTEAKDAKATHAKGTKERQGTVLLLSLRAGGVGLNLVAANNVFFMDPWWNYAVEAQAMDRVHRMGQEKEVRVTRFVCRESIEEKMLRIQERKKFLGGALGFMSEEEKRVQRIEDIRELLS